ncbi:hypothetical protein N9N67_02840 [Bacteriovoracaceae bacterium]|nr:hypothetical protein [Bacteriovoracaceae bacterium]
MEKDYIIIKTEEISTLGISADDPDLLEIGNDFVKPRSEAALMRLMNKIKDK